MYICIERERDLFTITTIIVIITIIIIIITVIIGLSKRPMPQQAAGV